MNVALRLAALVIVLLGTSGPQVAFAHGGQHHEAPAPARAEEPRQAYSPDLQVWSPGCPESPAHLCGCGNLVLCEPGGKPALHPDAARRIPAAAPAAPVLRGILPLPPSLPRSCAHARAPPVLS